MGSTLIRVDCVDQRLLISTAPVIASGGINEDIVEFHFCPLWDGFTKTAIFYRDESSVYYAVVGPDDRCTIPAEVLQSDGDMFFGVFGTSGSVTRTSEILRYKIKLGAITENLKPSEPTPDIYIQLLAALSAMDNKVDKIDGKGLSTNDYTDADKEKLAGVAEGATNVVVDSTLKNSGQAADAKTTGDRLGAVEAFTINPQEYELTGNPVQLDNYEGMPLNVITTLEPIQSGSGDPSPTNIRAISGWTGAKLNHTNDSGLEHTYSADFGQTVYGGTLDWQTGVLTVDRAFYTFDGSEGVTSGGWNNPYSYVLWGFLPDVVNCGMSDIADAYCSHYIVRSVANVITNAIAGFGIYDRGHLIFSSPTHADVDDFKSYLAAQHAAGTPVQIVYKLATPTTIQLTPQEILALDGMNTLYGDGTLNISGRKDILWLTSRLIERVKTLESAVISLGGNV